MGANGCYIGPGIGDYDRIKSADARSGDMRDRSLAFTRAILLNKRSVGAPDTGMHKRRLAICANKGKWDLLLAKKWHPPIFF